MWRATAARETWSHAVCLTGWFITAQVRMLSALLDRRRLLRSTAAWYIGGTTALACQARTCRAHTGAGRVPRAAYSPVARCPVPGRLVTHRHGCGSARRDAISSCRHPPCPRLRSWALASGPVETAHCSPSPERRFGRGRPRRRIAAACPSPRPAILPLTAPDTRAAPRRRGRVSRQRL
jgi:hypothetical protein